jgi:protein gp37
MGQDTKIEWTDHTFNIVWGCAKVSPACDNCYAETFSRRLGRDLWGKNKDRRTFGNSYWIKPLEWNAAAELAGKRARVFCSSMADVFEDHPKLETERAKLWDLIAFTPYLDWQLLTKRPENMIRFAPQAWRNGWPANVWAMTTVEDQKRADERIPHLLRVPAKVHGLSIEPLLGPIDLHNWLILNCFETEYWKLVEMAGGEDKLPEHLVWDRKKPNRIDWVIAGGESGPRARPMHPDWIRAIRAQCGAVGIPFFFKQWGEYRPLTFEECYSRRDCRFVLRDPTKEITTYDYCYHEGHQLQTMVSDHEFGWQYPVVKEGTRKTGRTLDGRTWDQFPQTQLG